MTAGKSSEDKNPIYKKWWFWLIVVIVVIMIGGGVSSSNDETQKVEEEFSKNEVTAPIGKSTSDTKIAIENECTDAKYGINNGFNPISATNYNFEMYDYAYTNQGDIIYLATWNGKNKTTDKQVVFQCYASKNSDESISVYYIQAGGKDIWKSQSDLDYSSYNKDGSPMYPELH